MAIVCDLCGKPARTRGPGQDMWSVRFVHAMSGGMSVHFEPIKADSYLRTEHAACGACLDKMGVLDLLAADVAKEAEQRRRLAERQEIDVTPPEARQIGPRRMRLLNG